MLRFRYANNGGTRKYNRLIIGIVFGVVVGNHMNLVPLTCIEFVVGKKQAQTPHWNVSGGFRIRH